MGKVQDYINLKKAKELRYTQIWVVESNRNGVLEPISKKITDIIWDHHKRITHKDVTHTTICPINRFILAGEKFPFEVDLVPSDISDKIEGHGTGTGDLWEWTYYCTLKKDDAEKYYLDETIRIIKTYKEKKNPWLKFKRFYLQLKKKFF